MSCILESRVPSVWQVLGTQAWPAHLTSWHFQAGCWEEVQSPAEQSWCLPWLERRMCWTDRCYRLCWFTLLKLQVLSFSVGMCSPLHISVYSWSPLVMSSSGYLCTLLSAIYLWYIPELVIKYQLVPLLRMMNKKLSFFAPIFLSFVFQYTHLVLFVRLLQSIEFNARLPTM